jgi:hypothetical protein
MRRRQRRSAHQRRQLGQSDHAQRESEAERRGAVNVDSAVFQDGQALRAVASAQQAVGGVRQTGFAQRARSGDGCRDGKERRKRSRPYMTGGGKHASAETSNTGADKREPGGGLFQPVGFKPNIRGRGEHRQDSDSTPEGRQNRAPRKSLRRTGTFGGAH